MREFDIFNKTEIPFYIGMDDGGYSDDVDMSDSVVLFCDIQPFNSELAHEQYGLTENTNYRLYTQYTDDVVVGDYCMINGEMHQVVYVESYSEEFGSMFLVRAVNGYD